MNTIEKIVVASLPRTGSTLLCETLAQHPKILGFGEIFLHNEDGRQWYHKKGTGGDTRFYPGPALFEEYIAYLESIARLEGRKRLSFKLMDYQEPLAWEAIRRWLPVVIHIRRDNVLECLASTMASERSGVWHARSKEDIAKAAETRVSVPWGEFAAAHARQAAFDERIRSIGAFTDVIRVNYEDLSIDYPETIMGVFESLGLDPVATKETQGKLNRSPLRERVENYEALREMAEGGDLERYFEE